MIFKVGFILQPYTRFFDLFDPKVGLPDILEGPLLAVFQLLFVEDDPRSVLVKEFLLKLTSFFTTLLKRRDPAEIPGSCMDVRSRL